MPKYLKLFCILLMLITFSLNGLYSDTNMTFPFRISISYSGEFFIHPGIIIGLEYKVAGNDENEFLTVLNVGFYYHLNNHLALFIYPEIGYRHIFPSDFSLQGFLGLGYLNYFPGADVYTVERGIVSKYNHPGYPSLMPSLRIGTGNETENNSDETYCHHMNFQFFGIYPFNGYMYKSFLYQIGNRYQLK